MQIKTALLSVWDKTGIEELSHRLANLGIAILSTGGTAHCLRKAGIDVISVSDWTGSPEILEGRVKTLHPRIHGGILARLENPSDQSTLEHQGITPIGLVVVNLYPFSRTVAEPNVDWEQAMEQIDIGGPTLLRGGAKNCRSVTVVVDPADYLLVTDELEAGDGQTRWETRRALATKAFRHTAAYDFDIADYFANRAPSDRHLPTRVSISLQRMRSLRYGENPHQRAALYASPGTRRGLVAAEQIQGKELSYNNYLDLAAAWELGCQFQRPFCGIIKHTNPCGAALAKSPRMAYMRALECDPVSAFGSVIVFNHEVDGDAAVALKQLFVEAIIAPAFSRDAKRVLRHRKNLRLMVLPVAGDSDRNLLLHPLPGGFLAQEPDRLATEAKELEVVTRRTPEAFEMEDLLFAWKICKHVKSNAIVLAKGGRTVGIGAGQMSRVDSVRLAVSKAQLPLTGTVLASDAFFPFRDGIDQAAGAGVRAMIQPGGSRRDSEVIEAANEHDMAMVFTAIRHFKH